MSFFIKACIEGLRRFPALNASVDGSDIIYHDYYDIGRGKCRRIGAWWCPSSAMPSG